MCNLASSKTTNAVNATVLAVLRSAINLLNNNNEKIPISEPITKIINAKFLFTIFSFGCLGGLFIIPLPCGSTPKAKAGRPSVTKFTQSICIAINGIGIPNKLARKINSTSPRLLDKR